jgi:4-amino-4-deoxy-L-arabinose transferase-like glycosyltransferase
MTMTTGSNQGMAEPVDRLPPFSSAIAGIRWRTLAVGLGILVILAYTLLYRLDQYPGPWYDEGACLKVSKNLALNGVYADYSSEGNRYLGPIFSSGPVVLVPIAGLFKLFGVGIWLPRFFIATFAALLLAALYQLTARLFTAWTGIVAVLLVAFSTSVDLQFVGRIVGGEVPATFFLLTALTLWLTPAQIRIRRLVGVGVLFGLACSTKFQFGVSILPALLISWIANLVWYRQRPWPFFVIPGAVAGIVTFGWLYIVIVTFSGPGVLSENWQSFRATSGNALMFDPVQIRLALDFLVSFGLYGGLYFFGLSYAVLLSLGRSIEHQNRSILTLLALGGTTVYLLAIADWTRYALPSLVIVSVFVADFFQVVTAPGRVQPFNVKEFLLSGRPTAAQATTWFFLVFLVSTIGLGAFKQANKARRQGDYASAFAVARFVQTNVPRAALLETWEKELSILTDDNYHYPPMAAETALTASKFRNASGPGPVYDFRRYVNPDYVIRGPFAKWAGAYTPDQLAAYQLVKTIGPYDVYQRIP